MKSTKTHTPTSRKQTEATAEVIKLGIDIHKTKYVVIRQIDNQAAQSPQRAKKGSFELKKGHSELKKGHSVMLAHNSS